MGQGPQKKKLDGAAAKSLELLDAHVVSPQLPQLRVPPPAQMRLSQQSPQKRHCNSFKYVKILRP
jgi:hypothetical protein